MKVARGGGDGREDMAQLLECLLNPATCNSGYKSTETLDQAETRALRLHLYAGSPEDKLLREHQRIQRERTRVQEENVRLEKRIEEAGQVALDEAAIDRFCELAATNIENFTFEDWRLALEALQIKVWVDGDAITIEGLIPITDFELLTQPS